MIGLRLVDDSASSDEKQHRRNNQGSDKPLESSQTKST